MVDSQRAALASRWHHVNFEGARVSKGEDGLRVEEVVLQTPQVDFGQKVAGVERFVDALQGICIKVSY